MSFALVLLPLALVPSMAMTMGDFKMSDFKVSGVWFRDRYARRLRTRPAQGEPENQAAKRL